MSHLRKIEFWAALSIIVITLLLMLGFYSGQIRLNFVVGPFRFTHWLSWIGTTFIAVFTPAFYLFRRRFPRRNSVLARVHVFGNLFAFMLISIHFAQQMGRSVHPEDHTGLVTYIIVSSLVASGFLHRFQVLEKNRFYPPHRNRFFHVAIALSFYIVIIIHILHNLGLLPI